MHLNQAHYEDIIEERSIAKLCGYPMCDKTLNNIPKQQYVIASSLNKVYDITERKKFCSNKCYKSSEYLKEQILTTPLWVRKDDDIIPEFKLLSFDDEEKNLENEQEIIVGKPIVQNLVEKQQENEENKQETIAENLVEKQHENEENEKNEQLANNEIGKPTEIVKDKDKNVDILSESSITSK